MASSPRLLITAIFVLSLLVLACSSREIPDEEGSECVFKGTCKTKADCVKICGEETGICAPGMSDHRCCCLQHDGPPPIALPTPRI